MRTFGGLAVERDGQLIGGAAGQRKPLALLALLASSGEQGITRDRLALILWPESDTAQSRNLLRQRLFHLKRDLLVTDLLEGTVQLRLNSAVMSSDVAEFERALERDDQRGAATAYAGPFLDGFHLNDAPEFERWSSQQREHFNNKAQRVLRELANQASAAGRHEEAVEWWRRLTMLDPLDSKVALALMQALATAGSTGAALRHAEAHEQLVREEVGIAPVGVSEMALQLSDEARAAGASYAASWTDASGAKRPKGNSKKPAVAAAAGPTGTHGSAADPTQLQRAANHSRNRLRIAAIPALTVALLSALWFSRSAPSVAASPEINESAVAVFPFQVHGADSYDYLREGLPDLLNIRLNGAGPLRSVDPRALAGVAAKDSTLPMNVLRGRDLAHRVGAGQYVLGSVIESGGTLHLVAKLYDRNAKTIGEAEADGAPTDLAQLVDRLTSRLMASMHSAPGERLQQTAALTTSSFPALKAYLIGEQEFRAARFGAAADAFQRAVKEDSTFALAYYRMAVAAESAPWNEPATDSAARRAVRFASRLPLRDRDLFSAFLARRRGDHDEAAQRYRIVVGMYPDEVEAWYQLAEIEFHYDTFRGLPLSAARRSYERVLRLRPGDPGALTHLYRIAAREGDRPLIDSLRRSLLRAVPARTSSPEFVTFHGAAMRDTRAIERGLAELSTVADEFVTVTMRHVAMFTLDVHTYGRIAHLLADGKRDIWYRAQGYHALANSHLARGRVREADAALQRQLGFGPDWSIELRGLYASLPFLPPDPLALDSLRKALTDRRAVRPMPPPAVGYEWLFDGWDSRLAPYALGLIALRSGDTASALMHADRLAKSKGLPADSVLLSVLSRTIRAELMRARGKPAEALQLLGDARPGGTLGQLGGAIGSQVYQRYLRAELLRDLGRYQDALRWYQSLVQGSGHEIIYLAPSYLRQAEIYDRLGQARPAIQNYRRFVELWNEGDPAVQPMVAAARTRIAQMESR
ncbi:MAG: hypothetical protein M3O61_03045 [Gemmatimonadota bacterium]|nr:hypothetical protein [Gemmatimonadota bacterium]